MSAAILVVDDSAEVASVVEDAVRSAGVSIVSVADIASAKRKLFEKEPVLIVCRVTLNADSEAGYRFSRDLQSHPSLGQVPLILVADEVTDEVIRKAADAGAKTLVPWPVSPESLGYRMAPLLPAGVGSSRESPSATRARPQSTPVQAPQASAATQSPSQSGQPARAPAGAPQGVPAQQPPQQAASMNVTHGSPMHGGQQPQSEKLLYAQQLLAKVLHNLRTSALLDVADMEDVPRIVLQMTRTVCGIREESKIEPGRSKEEQARAEIKSDAAISIDLDSLFRKK